MIINQAERQAAANRALGAFHHTVIRTGAYRFEQRAVPIPPPALPPPVIPSTFEKRQPKIRQHSSAFDEMAELIRAKSTALETRSDEKNIQADALLQRAFQYAVLMDGNRRSF